MQEFFKKGGIFKEDPETGLPKIKIYTGPNGKPKGDALVCYLKEESVPLAMELLDGAFIKPNYKVTLQKAQFQMKGKEFVEKKAKTGTLMSDAVRKKKQDQSKQLSWAESHEDVESDAKGLRIVVLKHMFNPADAETEPSFYDDLKIEVGVEVEKKAGPIEKITVFERNPEGAIAIKFKDPASALKCIDAFNGRFFGGQKLECDYFDGITDYRMKESEEETNKRIEEFGKWLETSDTDTKMATS